MLIVDVNEPVQELVPILAPVVPVTVSALNVGGWADYKWDKFDGKTRQCERKTWPELLSNVEHVEEQLQRHLTKNPNIELVFMLEGMVVQTELGTTIINSTNNPRIYNLGHRYTARLSGIYSWLFEITDYLKVIQTTTLRESAVALAAMYNHDQKETHTTFQRTIRQIAKSPNPMVQNLMGLGNGIGDKTASELILNAGTTFNVIAAGWEGKPVFSKYELTRIPGIGKTTLDNIYKGIGRPDV